MTCLFNLQIINNTINNIIISGGLMGKIIVDSIDKRMTAPLVEYLNNSGYEVYGITFKNSVIISNHLKAIFEISKKYIKEDLIRVLSQFTRGDYLLLGNPLMIEAVNEIKPEIKYIIPDKEAVIKATDKKRLMNFASKLNLKVPEDNPKKYPLIVKLNVSENVSLKAQQRYRIVRNEEEYKKAMAYFDEYKDNLIIQEYVEGKAFGVSMLLDDQSKLVDYIVHERILEYPISGGPSALCVSRYKRELVEYAYKLLSALKWTGYAMVEFKGDYLLEINPRFWGSMPLLFAAGSDFFGNYIKILDKTHRHIDIDLIPYKLNRKIYFFPQSFLALASYIKKAEFFKALEILAHIITAKEGIFHFKNPVPFLNYIRSLAKRNQS